MVADLDKVIVESGTTNFRAMLLVTLTFDFAMIPARRPYRRIAALAPPSRRIQTTRASVVARWSDDEW